MMPWDLPLLIMGELHITILPYMTGAHHPVNKDIQDFSFAEGSIINFHSRKRFSIVLFSRDFIYTLFIECFLRNTLGQTGP